MFIFSLVASTVVTSKSSTRIDYKKLTAEEFQVMIRVLGKSKHLRIWEKKRKKRK